MRLAFYRRRQSAPPLDEILEPIRRKFAESGMTEDQAAERYETEKHADRAAKRGRPFDE